MEEKDSGSLVKQNYGYLARDQMFQLLGEAFEGGQEGPQVKLVCRLIKNNRFYDSHKRVIGYVYIGDQLESINVK